MVNIHIHFKLHIKLRVFMNFSPFLISLMVNYTYIEL